MLRFILAAALSLPVLCRAQLAGEYQISFTNGPALWDFSGSYPVSNSTLQVRATLTHFAVGFVGGTGSAHVEDGAIEISANEIAEGQVMNAGKSGVQMSVKGAGTFKGTYNGLAISGPFTSALDLTLNPNDRTLTGTESGTICVAGRGCHTLSTNVTFQLPGDMDGTWSLILDVGTTNRTVHGTATVLLSNGRTLPFNARGTYSRAKDLSKLTLKGTDDAAGTSLTVTVDSDGQVQSLRGKLLGQKLRVP